MNKTTIKLPKKLCEMNVPFGKEGGFFYHVFTLPEGSVIDGKNYSGYIFSPMYAYEEGAYCVAAMPAEYKVQLMKDLTTEDGSIYDTDFSMMTAKKIESAIENAPKELIEREQQEKEKNAAKDLAIDIIRQNIEMGIEEEI